MCLSLFPEVESADASPRPSFRPPPPRSPGTAPVPCVCGNAARGGCSAEGQLTACGGRETEARGAGHPWCQTRLCHFPAVPVPHFPYLQGGADGTGLAGLLREVEC